MNITFGKYKGQSIYSIFDTDKAYCCWANQKINLAEKAEIKEVSRLLGIDVILDQAERDIKDSGNGWHYLSQAQSAGTMTDEQGARFINLLEAGGLITSEQAVEYRQQQENGDLS